MKEIIYNPFSPEFRFDPYRVYEELRKHDPVHKFKSFREDQWLLTRFDDVKKHLSSKLFVVDDLFDQISLKSRFTKRKTSFDNLLHTIKPWLFFNDMPQHRTLRIAFGNFFSPSGIAECRNNIRNRVDELISAKQVDGRMDIISDLAFPLPSLVMADLLGIPVNDVSEISEWSTELFRILVPPQSIENLEKMDDVAESFKRYLEPVLAERAQQIKSGENTQGNLLNILLARQIAGELSHEQLLGLCAMLFSVGQETTENLIGNGVLALLQHPEQMRILRENPQLLANAVDEMARFDTPVQGVARLVLDDIEIRGKQLKKGERVIFALSSALRDGCMFPAPNSFDIRRDNLSSLPFGAGIHFCLGAYLAKIQVEVVIERLLANFSHIELCNVALSWRQSVLLRGVNELPVAFVRRHHLNAETVLS